MTLWNGIRRLFFQIDAERAHEKTLSAIQLLEKSGGRFVLKNISQTNTSLFKKTSIQKAGLTFQSPIGLAAGFDKDAKILSALPYLGFGFAEIGTVTPQPQKGNPRPRLFREPATQSLFNKMGFNNEGASRIAQRVQRTRPRLPPFFRVGVNIGKNKSTPLERAHEDYVLSAQAFRELADYLVINVSSPNTPELRMLQQTHHLKKLFEELFNELGKWNFTPPVFLKLAPELQKSPLIELIQSVEAWGIDGWILTNTLKGHWQGRVGGWSGGKVKDLSLEALKTARYATHLPIISVGGILNLEEAQARFSKGADLIQLYTGWIYQGPRFPQQIAQERALA